MRVKSPILILLPSVILACGPDAEWGTIDQGVGGVPPSCPVAPLGSLSTPLPTPAATAGAGGVELGVKFRVRGTASLTAIRFHKHIQNTGPHVGHLWRNDGTLLATVDFTNVTGQGWQQADLPSPVSLTPGVTYIASYYAPAGWFSYSLNGADMGPGDPDGPAVILANGEDGGNGVYRYGGGFPQQTFAGANYFVDVVVDDATAPAAPSTLVGNRNSSTAVLTWGPSLDSTFTVQRQIVYRDGLELAIVAGDATSYTDTTTNPSLTHTYEIRGRDFCGNLSAASNTVTLAPVGTAAATIYGEASPVSIPRPSETIPIWLGVRFTSAVTGTITAVRFWRDLPDPQGASFQVQLWSGDNGWRLGQGTAGAGTFPGWQEVQLDTAVPIEANREYVAVYYSSGHWSQCSSFPGQPSSSDLTVVSHWYSYWYQTNYGFPRSPALANPCVDVRFDAGPPGPPPPPPPPPPVRPTESLFGTAPPPGTATSGNSVEVGVKVQPTADGFITGIRFYQPVASGPLTASLWSSTGTLLARATETAAQPAGWREVSFADDVQVTANTTYVASYFSNGPFFYQSNGLSTAITNGSNLVAPASAASGGNGVYRYGWSPSFPTNTYLASNYYVDVSFTTQSTPLPAGPVNLYGTADPVAPEGGATPVEVGFKVRPRYDGEIEAIRFFRSCGNPAGFTVYLYESTGALLATAQGGGTTAMHGWQSIPLSTPVPVTANTEYVASYHSSNGCFSLRSGGHFAELSNDYLVSPSNAASGGNGVYRYGPTGGVIPSNSNSSTDYFVDVEFDPTP